LVSPSSDWFFDDDAQRGRGGNYLLEGKAGPLEQIMGRRSLAGSNIGGIAETQERLDYCGANNITSDVEAIAIQDVNEAYERLLRSDVKYRFAIDMVIEGRSAPRGGHTGAKVG
jgi:hypothetical protein